MFSVDRVVDQQLQAGRLDRTNKKINYAGFKTSVKRFCSYF